MLILAEIDLFVVNFGCKDHLLTSDYKVLFASFWRTPDKVVLINFWRLDWSKWFFEGEI